MKVVLLYSPGKTRHPPSCFRLCCIIYRSKTFVFFSLLREEINHLFQVPSPGFLALWNVFPIIYFVFPNSFPEWCHCTLRVTSHHRQTEDLVHWFDAIGARISLNIFTRNHEYISLATWLFDIYSHINHQSVGTTSCWWGMRIDFASDVSPWRLLEFQGWLNIIFEV